MNSLKDTFQNMSSWMQLLFLCVFIFSGLMFASVLMGILAILFVPQGTDFMSAVFIAMQSVKYLWTSQFLTQVLVFLAPAIFCAWLFNKDSATYLKANKLPKANLALAGILSIFTIQPLISVTSYYNAKMKLPEFMSGIENWMQVQEKSNQMVIEQMLNQSSIAALIINLFIIAIMAGISEEFLFRGVIQQIFNRITRNYHIAIWISAIIFSAIHIQFYGFIPRVLLGALLGYLFVWSGNIWIPIVVHALNNALSVLLFKAYHGTPEYDKIENFNLGEYWWLIIISIILTGVIFSYLHRQYNLRIFKSDNF